MGERPPTVLFSRRKLPHWCVADRAHFVTICVKGSLPHQLTVQLRQQRQRMAAAGDDASLRMHRQLFRQIESVLDRGEGPVACLTADGLAPTLWDAVSSLEGRWHWRLSAAVIMPTHLHLLISAGAGATKSLPDALRHLKGYSAYQANRIPARRGRFWQEEWFDHWCRTPGKEDGVATYIRNNPVRAGLVPRTADWPWVR